MPTAPLWPCCGPSLGRLKGSSPRLAPSSCVAHPPGVVRQQALPPVPATVACSGAGGEILPLLRRSPAAAPRRRGGIQSPALVGRWFLHGCLSPDAVGPTPASASGQPCRPAQGRGASNLAAPPLPPAGTGAQLEAAGQSPASSDLQTREGGMGLSERRTPRTLSASTGSTPSPSDPAPGESTGCLHLCPQAAAKGGQTTSGLPGGRHPHHRGHRPECRHGFARGWLAGAGIDLPGPHPFRSSGSQR
jgi:hypothetical protein